jgi:hypothetical protein
LAEDRHELSSSRTLRRRITDSASRRRASLLGKPKVMRPEVGQDLKLRSDISLPRECSRITEQVIESPHAVRSPPDRKLLVHRSIALVLTAPQNEAATGQQVDRGCQSLRLQRRSTNTDSFSFSKEREPRACALGDDLSADLPLPRRPRDTPDVTAAILGESDRFADELVSEQCFSRIRARFSSRTDGESKKLSFGSNSILASFGPTRM